MSTIQLSVIPPKAGALERGPTFWPKASTPYETGMGITHRLCGLIDHIEAQADRLCIRLNPHAKLEPNVGQNPVLLSFVLPLRKRQEGYSRPIVIRPGEAPQPDPVLIALVADAMRWVGEFLIADSQTIQKNTGREALRSASVSRIPLLAWLGPDIFSASLEWSSVPGHTAKTLRNPPELPTDRRAAPDAGLQSIVTPFSSGQDLKLNRPAETSLQYAPKQPRSGIKRQVSGVGITRKIRKDRHYLVGANRVRFCEV